MAKPNEWPIFSHTSSEQDKKKKNPFVKHPWNATCLHMSLYLHVYSSCGRFFFMLSISANLHSRPLIASLIGTTHRVEHRGRQKTDGQTEASDWAKMRKKQGWWLVKHSLSQAALSPSFSFLFSLNPISLFKHLCPRFLFFFAKW